jgi:hypothetical protein
MKIAITGHTSGLGKFLFKKYSPLHDCIGFSRSNGFDLEKDYDVIAKQIKSCDLFINNSFATGAQMKYLQSCLEIKQVVMGSIAARNPNPDMPYYCIEKKKIEEYFLKNCTHTKKDYLYLQLTGASYKQYTLIYNTIEFWLKNRSINFIGFQTD